MDEPAGEPPRPARSRSAGRSRVWWTLATLTVAPWLVSLAARRWWFAELFTHFRFQCLLGVGAVAVVLIIARQWKPLALCGVVALLYGGPMLIGEVAVRAKSKALGTGVVTANVLTRNGDAGPLLAYLAAANPDIVCLQEIDDDWAAALAPLHARYPHRMVESRPDNFGMAVYSKRPARFETIDLHGVPLIRAAVDLPGGELVLFNAHVMPPIGAENAALRNRQMAEIAQQVGATDGPVAVCGDLNCTPWSPYFADLLNDGGLSDSRGGGRTPTTWRAGNPLFALPIDHVLPGGGAWVTGLEAGPDVGSDHRPLFARVHLSEG